MENAVFQNGAMWLRADFHLHTKADKEFKYSGEDDSYCSDYAEALKAAGISVGVVANHNKFDHEEFKALCRAARKKDIFLLPGVELSVSDGANGIHMLIVFDTAWIEQGHDVISPFITTMFPGKTPDQYQNENGRNDKNILQTVEELQKTERDFFLLFAHVEDDKGLWKEMRGGRLSDWAAGRYAEIRRRTLGFQKVRTRDERDKVKQWLGAWYPAEVEGSDPKSIEEIGKGQRCFLKLGAFTFEAVKFALVDHGNRMSATPPEITHSRIENIHFTGGILDGKTIFLSPELNTFIGIRGSGKSSVLEALRYALDIRVDDGDTEREYKRKLVERTLGSGGKIVLDAFDRHGQAYQIQRIWKERANVFYNGRLQPGISIQETILRKPLFFGQKELAAAGRGSGKDLIEKLLGAKCDDVRHRIIEQKARIAKTVEALSGALNVDEQIEEQTKIKQNAEFRLNLYKKHNLEEKLQKRLGFDADIRKAKEGIDLIEAFAADIRDLLADHEDDLCNFIGHSSAADAAFFKDFDSRFANAVASVGIIKAELAKVEAIHADLKAKYEKLVASGQGLADEFAAIERTLAEELKTTNEQDIRADEFLTLKKKLAGAEAALRVLSKSREQKAAIQDALYRELQQLNALWRREFKIIEQELEGVSQKSTALKFFVGFKQDKAAFLEYFKSIFRGSGIRETTFQKIVEQYQDFAGIYSDFEEAKKLFGSSPESFADLFVKNLQALLTYQTPNRFSIAYRGVELADHSLGQRASALILFVLGQKENDVIIIDQPEDDLDNQTIYEDVIKWIRELKPGVQFIFATHNPNIPVLGDAEQVHACSFGDGKISVQSGGLDDPEMQHKIVGIMEGGKEAFEKRKEIYRIWKP